MNGRHLIDASNISEKELFDILDMASIIMKKPEYFNDSCHGKLLATLFYEPSTRTMFSFQAAMLRLGGKTIGFSDPNNSSASKGESLKDTVRVVSGYTDIIAIRHFNEGAAKAASLYSQVPVINAGDGGHLHPTQTLTDLLTLRETKGHIDKLTIGLCGDLKNGRTVHSLVKTLSQFNNNFIFISTSELGIPAYIKTIIDSSGCKYMEVDSLEAVIGDLDVLYMTRIQKERFANEQDYQAQKNNFILDNQKLHHAKYGLKILHPLPRVNEIAYEVDEDPRAVYYEQTEYGMYARMALILHMLDGSKKTLDPIPESSTVHVCQNPNCITTNELYLPKTFIKQSGIIKCEFCEKTQ